MEAVCGKVHETVADSSVIVFIVFLHLFPTYKTTKRRIINLAAIVDILMKSTRFFTFHHSFEKYLIMKNVDMQTVFDRVRRDSETQIR